MKNNPPYNGPLQNLYRFYNAENQLLYVGISKNWVTRFHNHERDSAWFNDVSYMKLEKFDDYEKMLEAETLAIKTEMPLFNKAQNDSYESPTDHFQRIKESLLYKSPALKNHDELINAMSSYMDRFVKPPKASKFIALFFHSAYEDVATAAECRNCKALREMPMVRSWSDAAYADYMDGKVKLK